mgnify:CR=1 FL=1
MTTPSSTTDSDPAGNDQVDYTFDYGDGRMPFFMKIVWLGFLVFGAWYVVRFLLEALGDELGG